MFAFQKKLKLLAFFSALLFLLGTSFLSAHSHAASKGEKDHSCSVCQASHSPQKTLLSGPPLKINHAELIQRVSTLQSNPLNTQTPSASLIRGPPALS